MPVTPYPLINGSGWHFTQEGGTIIENAVASDVQGQGQWLIWNAYLMLVANGIDIGTVHNVVVTAFVTDIEPTAVSHNTVTFRITYKEYRFPTSVIEVGSSVAQVETDKDAFGERVTVQYTYPDDYEWNAYLKGVTKTQTGLLSKIQPEPSITITRREMITGFDLTSKKLIFEGTTNEAGWELEPDALRDQWLCTSIVGRSQDNGRTYDVTYTFQYRRDTWNETVRFIDPGTGQPPSDLVSGTGYKDVFVYETANFNLLELFLA